MIDLCSRRKISSPSNKISFKQLALIVFSSIFLWTFFASYMIYRNTPKKMITELADLIGLKARENKKKTKEALKAVTLGPLRWIAAQLSDPQLPEVYIDIKFKHFRKLQEKRKEALLRGVLFKEEDDYVPAKIRHKGRTIKVKLRLKGDWVDHLEGEKWSFRVHVKGKNYLLGLRRFSLQNPETRKYDGEVLFFEALKREGILAPRYSFVDLTVNGKKMGIMALEEHFSKELLESQGRRDGVILKFDESLVWQAEPEILQGERGFGGVYDNYKNAMIKPFRLKRIQRSEKLSAELKTATELLRAFVDGSLKPSQVFDSDLMGRFIAIGDFWGAWHALRWHNLRFYYNSTTGYLEPIGFDAQIAYNVKPDIDPSSEIIISKILGSEDSIRKVYRETLERLIKEAKNGVAARWITPLTEKNLGILDREFPFLDGIDLSIQTQWAEEKLSSLQRANVVYPKIVQAYLVNNEESSYLELQNLLPYNVVVSKIQSPHSSHENLFDAKLFPLKLSYTEKGRFPTIRRVYFQKNDIQEDSRFVVTVNIEGDKKAHTVEATPYYSNATQNTVPQATLEEALSRHSFLTFDKKANILRVRPGRWRVESWLVMPRDIELFLPEGTRLQFAPGVGIVANGGPLNFHGTKDQPVVLEGFGESASEGSWQGIIVLKSERPSHWNYTNIKNTTGIKYGAWMVNAGATFYESDAYLNHVSFSGNRSEDALNIIRSTFDLTEVDIKNAVSDGFDADFSVGVVTGGMFENLGHAGGGDGIDVSGTRVTIEGTRFHNIADKAISVGEESDLECTGLSMDTVGVGIVSKDGSRVRVQNSQIAGAKFAGLMAYVKKPVYPSATLFAENVKFSHSPSNAIVQDGSEIKLEGVDIEPTDLDVKNLYKTLMKSGIK